MVCKRASLAGSRNRTCACALSRASDLESAISNPAAQNGWFGWGEKGSAARGTRRLAIGDTFMGRGLRWIGSEFGDALPGNLTGTGVQRLEEACGCTEGGVRGWRSLVFAVAIERFRRWEDDYRDA